MQQHCLLCDRTSPDHNLFCQESYCPAEMSPTILEYGEWLGDLEIVKPIIVLRSAVLYEARHHGRQVLLKVAHPGRPHKERLKREAEFLRDLQQQKQLPPTLPTVLPPYFGTSIEHDCYGKSVLQGHLLYFCLFEFYEGEPLRDLLMKNPQPWLNHIGWLMISLAQSINSLHLHGRLHLALSPESLLVRFDPKPPSVPRLLLYDLGSVSDAQAPASHWYPDCAFPAYLAPELLQPNQVGYQSDVYGLALLLYEMLEGEPSIPNRLLSDEATLRAVRTDARRVQMERSEDTPALVALTKKNLTDRVDARTENAALFADELIGLSFGDVPPEKKRRGPRLETIFASIAALLLISFMLAMALSVTGG